MLPKLSNKYKIMLFAFFRKEVKEKLMEGVRYKRNSPFFIAEDLLKCIESINIKNDDKKYE